MSEYAPTAKKKTAHAKARRTTSNHHSLYEREDGVADLGSVANASHGSAHQPPFIPAHKREMAEQSARLAPIVFPGLRYPVEDPSTIPAYTHEMAEQSARLAPIVFPGLRYPVEDPSTIPAYTREMAEQSARLAPPVLPQGQGLHAPLTLGAADDPLEEQADALADRLVRSAPGTDTQLGRAAVAAAEPAPVALAASVAPPSSVALAPPREAPTSQSPDAISVISEPSPSETPASELSHPHIQSGPEPPPRALGEAVADAGRGDAAPLAAPERAWLEGGLGRDLSRVRLHDGPRADALARNLGARALTAGPDIFFARGALEPESAQGRHLLAHEVAHTVQQDAIGPRVQRSPDPAAPLSPIDDALDSADASTEPLSAEAAALERFVAQLRQRLGDALDPILAEAGRSTRDCPYLLGSLRLAERRSYAWTERTVRALVPERTDTDTLEEFIPDIVERAERAAQQWVQTGRLEDLPLRLPSLGASPIGADPELEALSETAQQPRPADSAHRALAQLDQGQPLASTLAQPLERAFGESLSHVRLHTEGAATALAQDAGASALTVGEHIIFAPGAFRPAVLEGQALLAHELAHTLQQRAATTSNPIAPTLPEQDEQSLEQDANEAALRALAHLHASDGLAAQLPLARPLRSTRGLRLQACASAADQVPTPAHELNLQEAPALTEAAEPSNLPWQLRDAASDGPDFALALHLRESQGPAPALRLLEPIQDLGTEPTDRGPERTHRLVVAFYGDPFEVRLRQLDERLSISVRYHGSDDVIGRTSQHWNPSPLRHLRPLSAARPDIATRPAMAPERLNRGAAQGASTGPLFSLPEPSQAALRPPVAVSTEPDIRVGRTDAVQARLRQSEAIIQAANIPDQAALVLAVAGYQDPIVIFDDMRSHERWRPPAREHRLRLHFGEAMTRRATGRIVVANTGAVHSTAEIPEAATLSSHTPVELLLRRATERFVALADAPSSPLGTSEPQAAQLLAALNHYQRALQADQLSQEQRHVIAQASAGLLAFLDDFSDPLMELALLRSPAAFVGGGSASRPTQTGERAAQLVESITRAILDYGRHSVLGNPETTELMRRAAWTAWHSWDRAIASIYLADGGAFESLGDELADLEHELRRLRRENGRPPRILDEMMQMNLSSGARYSELFAHELTRHREHLVDGDERVGFSLFADIAEQRKIAALLSLRTTYEQFVRYEALLDSSLDDAIGAASFGEPMQQTATSYRERLERLIVQLEQSRGDTLQRNFDHAITGYLEIANSEQFRDSITAINTRLGSMDAVRTMGKVLLVVGLAGLSAGLAGGAATALLVGRTGLLLARGGGLLTEALVFTLVHREGSDLILGGNHSSFGDDFALNLLMLGSLRATGSLYHEAAEAIRYTRPIAYTLGQHATSLASLQGFAEVHHLLEQGEAMSAEERSVSLLQAASLHFGLQLGRNLAQPLVARLPAGFIASLRAARSTRHMLDDLEPLRRRVKRGLEQLDANQIRHPIGRRRLLADVRRLWQAEHRLLAQAEQEGILPQQGEPEATRQLIANIARIELELAADGRTADSGARSLFRSLGHGRIAYLPAARAELQAYFAERGSLREAADGVLEGRIADGPAIRYEPRADLTAESLEPSPPGPAPELPAEARELIDQLAQREPRVAGRLRDSEQMRRIFAESPEAALRMLRLWRTAQQVPGADTHLHRTGMVWIADGLLLNIIAPPDIARGRRPSRGARAECARAAIHFLETLEAELPDGQFRRRLVRKRAALTQGITELRQRLGDQIVEDPAALEAFGRLQAELRAALTLQPADAPGVVQLEEFFTLFQLAGRRRYQLLVEPGPTGPQSNAATLAGLQEAGYVEVRSGRLEPGEGQPPVILTAPPGRAIGEHPAASNPRVVGFDWGGQERPGPSWEPVAEQAARLAQSNFWSLHAYVQDHHLGPLVRAELAEVRPFNDGALAEEARTDPFGLGERLCEQALRAPDEHQPIRELNQLQLALREALRRASANARRTLAERSPADPAPSERTRLIAERPLPADLQDVTVHVGEQVRSPEVRITDLFEHLESVIELGVTRIGHATILGFELPRQMPELGFSRLESEAVWVRQSNVGRAHLEVYSDYQVARMEARRLHLLSLIVRRGIWIEISPTSNAVLSGLDRLRHPVAGMLRAQPQLRITANTDDPGLLGTSLPQELSWLGTSIGASQAQLVRLILAGYDSRLGARPIDNAPQLRARISTALIRDIPPAERLQVLRQLRQRYPGGPAEPDAPISPEAFGQALGWYLDLVLY